SADGHTIYFTAVDKALVNLYAIAVAGGTPKLVAKGGAISQIHSGPDFVLFSKSTMTAPPELFRVSPDGGGTKELTNENGPWLSQTHMPQFDSLTVNGAAGIPVQYWLMKPPNFDPSKKYPAVFLIHGGPQGAWEDGWSYRWNPALWASQGWVIAAPNPRGSSGF